MDSGRVVGFDTWAIARIKGRVILFYFFHVPYSTLHLPIQFPHLNWQFVQQCKAKFCGLPKSARSPCRIYNIQTSKPPARKPPPPILMTELRGAQFWPIAVFPLPVSGDCSNNNNRHLYQKEGTELRIGGKQAHFPDSFSKFSVLFFAESTKVRSSVRKFLFSLLKAER